MICHLADLIVYCLGDDKSDLESFSLNWGDPLAFLFPHPLDECRMKFLTFTLNTISFSSNPAPGKPAFAMISVARAGEEDGEAKGAKKDPG